MKYDVEITDLDHMGRGIARINNKIVFIPKSIPLDKCKIKIIKEKKNYCEGEIIEILEKSPKRIDSICSKFNECGGCDLLVMTYEEQLKYKENKVKNIISRYTNIDTDIKNIVASPDQYFYRNKVNFKVKEKIGFYKKKSYEIINIDKCFIADERINEILELIKKNMDLDGINEITIRTSKDNIMVIFNSNRSIDVEGIKDKVNSIYVNDEKVYGSDYIKEKIGDYEFVISPDSFFQVNTKQTKNLYEKVLEYANLNGDEVVLDLYSGTGTIGIYLSSLVKKVMSIEINKSAVKDAKKNKEINDVNNIEFLCGDASKLIENIKEKIDVVVVDPPRAGLNDEGIKNIKKISSNKLVYVSCNPVTLARDLDRLSDMYDVLEITPFDMFPNTYHVENVCLLKLK